MGTFRTLLAVTTIAFAVAGCGDNSKLCGPGTIDQGGECLPTAQCGPGTKVGADGSCVPDGSTICTDGTVFDMATGHCAIDPNSCQGGTVLIDGACQDPAAGLVVDLEEGAEPNGLGILGETSNVPAGVAALKAVGAAAYVLHGTIVPADHDGDGVLDNDVDTYVLAVAGPTLLDVTADGVHGLTAASITVANVASTDALASYERFGVNTTGDTSARQLFLPRAGTYLLAIADARALFLDGAVAGAEAGKPAFEYYVSIKNLAIPTPTTLPVVNGIAASPAGDRLGRELKVFTAALGTGMNEATLQENDTTAIGALVAMDGATFRGIADERDLRPIGGPVLPASLGFGGVLPTSQPYFVVDARYNYAYQPTAYAFQIAIGDGTALSTTGATVGAPKHASAPVAPGDFTYFFFDVAHADDTLGVALAWDVPTDAAIVDADDRVVAPFTWGPGGPAGDTMTTYHGLVRFARPGRYYVKAYDPAAATGTLHATSTLATLVPATIALGTPLTGQDVSPDFQALPFTYASSRATAPWQRLVSSVSTGALATAFYNPADAYGRLDPLAVSGTLTPGDATPVFAGTDVGRVLLDDPSDTYYVHVRPAITTGTRTVALDFAPRAFHDYGTVTPGTDPPTVNDTTTKTADPPKYYLIRATPGSRMTLTAHPTNTPSATQDLAIDLLAADETATTTFDLAGSGADETGLGFTSRGGWLAFAVREGKAPASSDYALAVDAQAAVTYTVAAGTTAYADACATGAHLLMPGVDDAVSVALPAPTGFTLFGAPATTFTVSTNGFLAFANPTNASAPYNLSLPSGDGIAAMIAPYWDDLDQVSVCTKLTGTKLTIQWTGVLCDFDPAIGACTDTSGVAMQAILDGSDGSIELVYGPGQQALGASATIGIEDAVSATATLIGFDQAGAIAASSSKKLTPSP